MRANVSRQVFFASGEYQAHYQTLVVLTDDGEADVLPGHGRRYYQVHHMPVGEYEVGAAFADWEQQYNTLRYGNPQRFVSDQAISMALPRPPGLTRVDEVPTTR